VDRQTVVASKPVTISGAKSGLVPAVLDGSVPLATKWSKLGGPNAALGNDAASCIFSSELLAQEVSQLWVSPSGSERAAVGGREALTNLIPLTPARFPNAKLSDDSVFDSAPVEVTGRRNASVLYSAKASTSGNLIDDGEHKPSLASSGIDFTGTIAVLPLGTMGSATQGVRVKNHIAGQSSFSYDSPPDGQGHHHMNLPYFFEGSCKLLDAEGEWCIEGGRLHVWLDSCADPNERSFRGKVRQHLLNATRLQSRNHAAQLTLAHLVTWAGSLSLPQTDVTLDTVQLLYPTWHRRSLDELGLTEGMDLRFSETRGSIRVIDSVIAWDASVVPFDKVGQNAYFSGNLFTRNGYALSESASLSDRALARGLIFEHNTVTHFNAFVGITPPLESTISYNLFRYQRPSVDGAAVHVHIKQQNGVFIYRNWALDLTVKGYRFDRINQPGATWGTNGTAMGNVAMRTGATTFKGDTHHIQNNLCFDVLVTQQPALSLSQGEKKSEPPSLVVMMYDPSKSWSKPGENAGTVVKDNAADSIFNISGKLPGIHSGNVAGMPVRHMLENPDEFDFRPKVGSPLVGVGPYPDPAEEYWVPGCNGTSDRRKHARMTVTAARAFYRRIREASASGLSVLV